MTLGQSGERGRPHGDKNTAREKQMRAIKNEPPGLSRRPSQAVERLLANHLRDKPGGSFVMEARKPEARPSKQISTMAFTS